MVGNEENHVSLSEVWYHAELQAKYLQDTGHTVYCGAQQLNNDITWLHILKHGSGLKCTDQSFAYSTELWNVQVNLYNFMVWFLHVDENVLLLSNIL
jgi:hypothetical protein